MCVLEVIIYWRTQAGFDTGSLSTLASVLSAPTFIDNLGPVWVSILCTKQGKRWVLSSWKATTVKKYCHPWETFWTIGFPDKTHLHSSWAHKLLSGFACLWEPWGYFHFLLNFLVTEYLLRFKDLEKIFSFSSTFPFQVSYRNLHRTRFSCSNVSMLREGFLEASVQFSCWWQDCDTVIDS